MPGILCDDTRGGGVGSYRIKVNEKRDDSRFCIEKVLCCIYLGFTTRGSSLKTSLFNKRSERCHKMKIFYIKLKLITLKRRITNTRRSTA